MQTEAIKVSHCRNREFSVFALFLWWPWPGDLHIRTWHVSREDAPWTKHERSTSRISQVTDRPMPPKTLPRRFAGGN